MLFVRDELAVIGEREIDVDEAIRDVYAPTIADDGARLLWYLYSTHGAGNGYYTIVITAVRDGAAWERLSRRLRYGDLAEWSTQLDTMTYSTNSSMMVSTEWSPLANLDFDSLPTQPVEHEVSLFREDAIDNTDVDGSDLARASEDRDAILTCIAGFRPFMDRGPLRILYGASGVDEMEQAFATDGWADWSGSLTPTLPHGAHRSARLLRDVPWSPMGRA